MPGQFADDGARTALEAGVTTDGVWVALLTSAPSDDTTMGTMDELVCDGYERQSVSWDAVSIVDGKASVSNGSAITFGPFTEDPDNVTHCALVSSDVTNKFVAYWELDTAKDADSGDSIEFAVGALTMTLD